MKGQARVCINNPNLRLWFSLFACLVKNLKLINQERTKRILYIFLRVVNNRQMYHGFSEIDTDVPKAETLVQFCFLLCNASRFRPVEVAYPMNSAIRIQQNIVSTVMDECKRCRMKRIVNGLGGAMV